MKVIFLDVDGVLNWVGTEDRIDGYIGLCRERIQRLNRICDAHPDAKIVVSSTWRHAYRNGMEDLVALLKERGVTAEIIDHTPVKMSYVPRGGEIRMWIEGWREENPGQDLNFVILDDDTEGMEGLSWERYDGRDEETDEEVYTQVTSEDLRPRHVVSYWDGEQRLGKGYNEICLDVEGGLQDYHVEQAIAVLNGDLMKVRS